MLRPENTAQYAHVSIFDPETGSSTQPSQISASCYADGSLTPMTLTSDDNGLRVIGLTATGQYTVRVMCSTANGFVVGETYHIRVNATVGTVTAETAVSAGGTFMIAAANPGVVLDQPISQAADDVWQYTHHGQELRDVLCWAAIGAGAGVMDSDVGPFDTSEYRTESFDYFDGQTAWSVEADVNGQRRSISLNP